jgi:hypothetical protein
MLARRRSRKDQTHVAFMLFTIWFIDGGCHLSSFTNCLLFDLETSFIFSDILRFIEMSPHFHMPRSLSASELPRLVTHFMRTSMQDTCLRRGDKLVGSSARKSSVYPSFRRRETGISRGQMSRTSLMRTYLLVGLKNCAGPARGSCSRVASFARKAGIQILLPSMGAAPVDRRTEGKTQGTYWTNDSLFQSGEKRRLEASGDG